MKIDMKAIKNSLQKTGKKIGRVLKKRAPEILTGISMVTGVGATVVACKETTTVDAVVEPYQDIILEARESGDTKALMKAYASAGLAVTKHYLPAIALQTVSLGTNYGSLKESKKNYAEIGAAYLSLGTAFSKYRERTKELVGEEKEEMLNAGIKEILVDDVYVDDNGKKKKSKRKEQVMADPGPFNWLFDETNVNFDKNPEINFFFLKKNQTMMNNYLQRDKVVMFNEVLNKLGVDKKDMPPEGQLWGWYIDDDHPNTYIDFGIFDMENPDKRRFAMGQENCIWLTFNLMPDAWTKLGEV